MQEQGGINLYAYVNGGPLGYVDPDGRDATLAGVEAGFVIAGPPGAVVGAAVVATAGVAICTFTDLCNFSEEAEESETESCPSNDKENWEKVPGSKQAYRPKGSKEPTFQRVRARRNSHNGVTGKSGTKSVIGKGINIEMVHTTKMVNGKEIKTSCTRRGVLNVSKETQKELCRIFPNLLDLYEDNDGIKSKRGAISVFDHWLNEEEYLDYVNSSNSVKESYLRKLDEFAFYMATNYKCYTFKVVGRGKKRRISFRYFTDSDSISKMAKQKRETIPSRTLYKLVFPTLGVSYFEGWENTNYIYSSDYAGTLFFSKLAEEKGLSFLRLD
ncbi:hypothetical protein [Vibrio sp. D173a]|uniref:hypothetical protein n=1 Tax=Vibrio sp. D173a TaxID=2836349 RepID=UPI0025523D22|nr:hypothetical protein [Vibrio sp. D173a]